MAKQGKEEIKKADKNAVEFEGGAGKIPAKILKELKKK